AGRRKGLAADAGEERGEAPVVVLAPFLVRVMVALRARDPLTQEDLRHIVGELLRRLHLLVPDDRRIAGLVAGRGEQIADESVERRVARERRADPLVERERALGPAVLATAADAEDVGPLVREIVAVLGPIQKRVDESIAFSGVGISDESSHLLRCGARHATVE